MKKITLFLSVLFLSITLVNAQKYMTKAGTVKFSSETPMEKIEAVNHQANSAIDFSTGDFVFKVLIPGFEFPKALMQEHFNENYMESVTYPDAKFIGKVVNIKDVNPAKEGIYKVVVEGNLTMHGVTNKIKENGTLEVKGGKVLGKATFSVTPSDYNIKIPKAVIDNIAKAIQVDVNVSLDKLN
ncbi:MAG: YceI family protein [Bacteroidota bacterium]